MSSLSKRIWFPLTDNVSEKDLTRHLYLNTSRTANPAKIQIYKCVTSQDYFEIFEFKRNNRLQRMIQKPLHGGSSKQAKTSTIKRLRRRKPTRCLFGRRQVSMMITRVWRQRSLSRPWLLVLLFPEPIFLNVIP